MSHAYEFIGDVEQPAGTDSHNIRARHIAAGPQSARPLAELGEVLAAGLIRLESRKSSGKSAAASEEPLDFPARRSGHSAPKAQSSKDA